MGDLNQVTLRGEIVHPVEFSKMGNGTPVARFTLVTRRGGEKSLIPVSAIGEVAEKALRLSEGDYVLVTGRLRQERWTADGDLPRSKLVVYADTAEWAGRKNWPAADQRSVRA